MSYYNQPQEEEEEREDNEFEKSASLEEKLKREKKETRRRWFSYRFPDLLMSNLLYFLFAGLIVFFVGIIISACDRPYLPWNRGIEHRQQRQPVAGSEDFGPEWGGTAGGTSPHDRPPAASVASALEEAGVGSVRPYPAGVIEDWCMDLEDDVTKWRRYLNPTYDWSHEDARYSDLRRRASIINNLRSLVEHWDRNCTNEETE